jgi:hypothetical protein
VRPNPVDRPPGGHDASQTDVDLDRGSLSVGESTARLGLAVDLLADGESRAFRRLSCGIRGCGRELPVASGGIYAGWRVVIADDEGVVQDATFDVERVGIGMRQTAPAYRCVSAATSSNPQQRFSPVRAVLAAGQFAAGCHWLRPLGSISAPHPASVVFAWRSAACDGDV